MLPVAIAVVLAPFVVAAVRMLADRSAFWNSGDQALVGLSVHEASHFHQLLGPYSRFGWSHPGPSWFYLLAPFFKLLGGTDASLVAANIVVQGLFAVAVVVAVHRRRRPTLTLAGAAVVALYVARMPDRFFVYVWNPLALMLAAALLLVLAVRARQGRWTDLLLLVITGSYLVQTHLGTGPLVGAVGACAVVAFAIGWRTRRRSTSSKFERREVIATAALGVVLIAMWVPPVYQQLTAPHAQGGNLGDVLHFALHQGSASHPLHQAVVATGRLLVMMPYGWDTGPYEMHVNALSAAVALGLAGQALVSLGLVAGGRRWRSPGAMWTGVVTFVALLAGFASARNASGVLYWYLLTWITVIPAVTLVGVAVLVCDPPSTGEASAGIRARVVRSRQPLIALAVVLAVCVVIAGVRLSRGVDYLPNSPGVGAASSAVQAALRGEKPTTIKVDIQTPELWTVAAGVANELAAGGWKIRVGPQSATLFGADRVEPGPGRTDLTVVRSDDPRVAQLVGGGVRNLGSVDTEAGRATILLKTP